MRMLQQKCTLDFWWTLAALVLCSAFGCADSKSPGRMENALAAVQETESPEPPKPHHLKVGLVRIEVDSTANAARRLNRLGANWEFIPPNLPPEKLQDFDVIYFPAEWGKLDGLSGLRETFHQYVNSGGGLLFAGPDVTGSVEVKPALSLLPYPLSVEAYPHDVGSPSVVEYAPGKPHPLVYDVKQKDMPLPRDAFLDVDDRWTVVAKSSGKEKTPTILTAEIGQGRIVLHTDYDDHGHSYALSDRFVVRMVNWLARAPEDVVSKWSPRFGQRVFPEFVRQMQQDYRSLIAKEPKSVREALERADSLLRKEAQQGSTWTEYRTAINLLNQSRSRAAIPCMLILLNDEDLNVGNFKETVLQSLTMLTGERLPSQDPEVVAKQWWLARKNDITVDMDQMSEQQIQIILDEFLKIVSSTEPMGLGRTPPMNGRTLHAVLACGYRVYASQYRKVLHRRLLPGLLKQCERPDRRWLTPGPLAAMYVTKVVPELPAIVSDPEIAPRIRVVVATGLFRAKATPSADVLLPLWDAVSETDMKQALAVMLATLPDKAAATAAFSAMTSDNEGIREAAFESLNRNGNMAHLKVIHEFIINEASAGNDLTKLFEVLRHHPHQNAIEVYVDLIRHFLSNSPEGPALKQSIKAFVDRTSVRLGEPADLPQTKAIAILKWWDEQQ